MYNLRRLQCVTPFRCLKLQVLFDQFLPSLNRLSCHLSSACLSVAKYVHLHLSWILDPVHVLHVGLFWLSPTLYADPRLSLHKYLRNSLYPATVIGHRAFYRLSIRSVSFQSAYKSSSSYVISPFLAPRSLPSFLSEYTVLTVW